MKRVCPLLFVIACSGSAGGPSPSLTGTTGSTGTTGTTADTGGTCDPTETVVGFFCQQDLCNDCGDDCASFTDKQGEVPICTTGSTPYGCCTVDQCTDPALGTFDRITCPDAYGSIDYWYDPATGMLTSWSWSTDYNGWCDGGAFGQLFGPDLQGCN